MGEVVEGIPDKLAALKTDPAVVTRFGVRGFPNVLGASVRQGILGRADRPAPEGLFPG